MVAENSLRAAGSLPLPHNRRDITTVTSAASERISLVLQHIVRTLITMTLSR